MTGKWYGVPLNQVDSSVELTVGVCEWIGVEEEKNTYVSMGAAADMMGVVRDGGGEVDVEEKRERDATTTPTRLLAPPELYQRQSCVAGAHTLSRCLQPGGAAARCFDPADGLWITRLPRDCHAHSLT